MEFQVKIAKMEKLEEWTNKKQLQEKKRFTKAFFRFLRV
jgi:hypothetical protein